MHEPAGSDKFPFGRVELTIAHHGSMLPEGSYGGVAVGAIVDLGGKRADDTGDSALTYDMRLYGEEGIDLLVLPIGDNYTIGPEDALRCVKLVNPKVVISAPLRHLAAHCPGCSSLLQGGRGRNGRQVSGGGRRAERYAVTDLRRLESEKPAA